MNANRKVGVVVGRFQTPMLHAGHLHLLDTADNENDELLILLGVSPASPGAHDPLDYKTRVLMLEAMFPRATIEKVSDHPSDEVWSQNLDRIVGESFPGLDATLYGSRDCFFTRYTGKLARKEVVPVRNVSATNVRNGVNGEPLDSEDFRRGVMYAVTKQFYPTSFQAVDIAILNHDLSEVLVGRKPNETSWRFPGGFVDPTDTNLELAAKREALEEVGFIEIDDVKYVSSHRIDDYRYRKSEHKIMSALFCARYIFGGPTAGDDLAEVKWQKLEGLVDYLMKEHKPLAETLLRGLKAGILLKQL